MHPVGSDRRVVLCRRSGYGHLQVGFCLDNGRSVPGQGERVCVNVLIEKPRECGVAVRYMGRNGKLGVPDHVAARVVRDQPQRTGSGVRVRNLLVHGRSPRRGVPNVAVGDVVGDRRSIAAEVQIQGVRKAAALPVCVDRDDIANIERAGRCPDRAGPRDRRQRYVLGNTEVLQLVRGGRVEIAADVDNFGAVCVVCDGRRAGASDLHPARPDCEARAIRHGPRAADVDIGRTPRICGRAVAVAVNVQGSGDRRSVRGDVLSVGVGNLNLRAVL